MLTVALLFGTFALIESTTTVIRGMVIGLLKLELVEQTQQFYKTIMSITYTDDLNFLTKERYSLNVTYLE